MCIRDRGLPECAHAKLGTLVCPHVLCWLQPGAWLLGRFSGVGHSLILKKGRTLSSPASSSSSSS
eukprot:6079749-Karenia_brevis.AAC.1